MTVQPTCFLPYPDVPILSLHVSGILHRSDIDAVSLERFLARSIVVSSRDLTGSQSWEAPQPIHEPCGYVVLIRLQAKCSPHPHLSLLRVSA